MLPSFGPPARDPAVRSRLREVAEAADELGYHVVFDGRAPHLPAGDPHALPVRRTLPVRGDRSRSSTSPTTLAWVAALTRHVRLGASVMVLPYHEPIALAKALATIDVLSGGRLMVGVASGWLREEFDLLGVPFRERGARTDEYLAAAARAVDRGARHVPRALRPARGRGLLPEADAEAAPADLDRRRQPGRVPPRRARRRRLARRAARARRSSPPTSRRSGARPRRPAAIPRAIGVAVERRRHVGRRAARSAARASSASASPSSPCRRSSGRGDRAAGSS